MAGNVTAATAISSLLVIVALSLLVTRVATMPLVATGSDRIRIVELVAGSPTSSSAKKGWWPSG